MITLPHYRRSTCRPIALGLLALACFPLSAFSANFTATNEASLRESLASAEDNNESDRIDLNGEDIVLNGGPLTYNGDGEGELIIENGSLTATAGSNILEIMGNDNVLPSMPNTVFIRSVTFSEGFSSSSDASLLGQGGAIFSRLRLVVVNSTFRSNEAESAGGAIFGTSTIDVRNSFFEDNSAVTSGGGAIAGGSRITVVESAFVNNSSDRGGAIFVGIGTELSVRGSTFDSNTATSLGGATFATGAGSFTVSESTFIRNSAVNGGGAMHFQSRNQESVSIKRVTMWDNTGGGINGAAIRNFESEIELVNTFIGSNLDDDSTNCQLLRDPGGVEPTLNTVDSLATDDSCGSPTPTTDSSNFTPPEQFASFFGSEALAANISVGNGGNEGLLVLIPAERGSLDDGSANVCPDPDQRRNLVVDGFCDIGSVELLPNEQDFDGDGFNDEQDNCPMIPNNQDNLDGDRLGDVCDDDIDNDGTPNDLDVFPRNAAEKDDTDGDGVGNNADTDDDGDGQLDVDESNCGSNPLDPESLSADNDGDGIPDCIDLINDLDSDGDGVNDDIDAFPNDPNEFADTDGDEVGDNADAFPNDPARAVSCEPGFFGAFLCNPAEPGFFVSGSGQLEATACEIGRFSSEFASTFCQLAPVGSFVDTSGATAAVLCPAGMTTLQAGTTSAADCFTPVDDTQPVTVYQNVNFQGNAVNYGEGDVSISDLRASSVGNDVISSIQIAQGYEVLACQNSRFRGRCEIFTENVSDLRQIGFNDAISSLRVSKVADLPVTVYQHVNFQGNAVNYGEGDVSISDLRASSVGNDVISSIQIAPGYEVLACQNSRFRGRCEIFTENVSDLRQIGFNDAISSLRVSKVADLPVTVFRDIRFGGQSLSVDEGDVSIEVLRSSSVGNDRISSILIAPGYEVYACQDSAFRGRCETYTSPVSDFRAVQFNDVISSFRVQSIR